MVIERINHFIYKKGLAIERGTIGGFLLTINYQFDENFCQFTIDQGDRLLSAPTNGSTPILFKID
ncbi:MAG: hypothetical protein COB33_001925 [Thiotrichaceae bacterium]|nr:hypothetical protein [Thiotrichaceae bacterium]PCI13559.1 MAG: hypothetical protein COB71_05275 [Thiotrichales bacterium]